MIIPKEGTSIMFQANYKHQLQIAYRNHMLVPFVGSGLSAPLGVPKWKELLRELLGEYESYNIDKEKFDTALLDYRYLDAVDCIIDAGVDELDLQRSVSTIIQAKLSKLPEEKPDNIFKDLSEAKCTKYLTTNYDNMLSDYVGEPPRRIEMLADDFVNEWDSGHYDNFVFNIHGDYTSPASIILSRCSYKKLYADEKYKDILEMFKHRYTLIFLGYSMEDEFVRDLFSTEFSKFKTRHFIVLSNIDEEKRRKLESEYNIRVISYTAETNEDHLQELRLILKEIQDSNNLTVSDYIRLNRMSVPGGLNIVSNKGTQIELGNHLMLLDEIDKMVDQEQYSEALEQYILLQSDLFGVELSRDMNLRFYKGILVCRINLRKYEAVQRMLPQIDTFEKGTYETQIYPLLLDFYMNTGRYDEALASIQQCLAIEPFDVVYTGMLHYVTAMKESKDWEDIKKDFIDGEWNLIITSEGKLIEKAVIH